MSDLGGLLCESTGCTKIKVVVGSVGTLGIGKTLRLEGPLTEGV